MEKKSEKIKIESVFYWLGIGAALLLFLAAFTSFLWWDGVTDTMPQCAMYRLTGLYCPGCGGTRAVGAFLRGQLLLSLYYHPVVLYLALLLAWFLISHTLDRISKGRTSLGLRYHEAYVWIALVLTLLHWLFSNGLLLLAHIPLE